MSYQPILLPENHRQDFAHVRLPLLDDRGDVILVRDGSYFTNVPRYCDYISDRHTWGYQGQGPTGLAFDTLYHFTKDYDLCCKFSQEFASKIYAALEGDKNHVIERSVIEEFIEEKLKTKGGV